MEVERALYRKFEETVPELSRNKIKKILDEFKQKYLFDWYINDYGSPRPMSFSYVLGKNQYSNNEYWIIPMKDGTALIFVPETYTGLPNYVGYKLVENPKGTKISTEEELRSFIQKLPLEPRTEILTTEKVKEYIQKKYPNYQPTKHPYKYCTFCYKDPEFNILYPFTEYDLDFTSGYTFAYVSKGSSIGTSRACGYRLYTLSDIDKMISAAKEDWKRIAKTGAKMR